MEKTAVVLLLLWVFQASGASFPFIENYLLLIDCGTIGKFTEQFNNKSWFPDSFFMDSGKTEQITAAAAGPQFMTTLRYFPKHQDLNCYNLPLTNTEKYIFRAGFYYANYDGKSAPPVFDLLLGGQLWETVNSSASDAPIFHELIYTPRDGNISVCLRGGAGGTPFISSLEATYLRHYDRFNQTVYTKMRNGTAYHLLTRLNFGSDQLIEPWCDRCGEELNRYWKPQQMPGHENVSFGPMRPLGSYYENSPPASLLNTAISPPNSSQSIHVPISFAAADPQSAYIVLYFHQTLDESQSANASRYMDVYVDGVIKANVKLETFESTEVVTLYPVLVQGTANLTVSPANGTMLPPLLNGLEVFTSHELDERAIGYGYKVSSSFMLLSVFHALFLVLG